MEPKYSNKNPNNNNNNNNNRDITHHKENATS
jgi:hypothetical protein